MEGEKEEIISSVAEKVPKCGRMFNAGVVVLAITWTM
jgi:hypothetical protein